MSDLNSQSHSIQTIYGWYRDGKLIVNRAYQRKLVWTLAERRKLIDSVERRYPIPLVLLAEVKRGDQNVFEIIDGLQRLHTIMSFIENGFPDEDGKYFDVSEFPTAKRIADEGKFEEIANENKLGREAISRFLDYSLPVSVIKNADDNTITDVFGRINTYGHRLSDQEQRQAGQLSSLAQFVRKLSSEIRGDDSVSRLPLHDMPEISIDLPNSRAGYAIKADSVWWVQQGILRSTDLRDSLDEQLLADWAVCVSDQIIERSKDALDRAFDDTHADSERIGARIGAIGEDNLRSRLKYVIEVIGKSVNSSDNETLSRLVFAKRTNNSFATLFVGIGTAIYEIIFNENKLPADFEGIARSLSDVNERIGKERTREARRSTINLIKGLIQDCFSPGDVSAVVHGGNREMDLRNLLRRSKIESAHFELKQGLLSLQDGTTPDAHLPTKINETIVGIANNGFSYDGAIVIGIADSDKCARRVKEKHGIDAKNQDGHLLIGVEREAKSLSISLEAYFQKWRNNIVNSGMSEALKNSVVNKMAICEIGEFSLLLIPVPPQSEPSFLDGKLYVRKGDQTIEGTAADTLSIARRFD